MRLTVASTSDRSPDNATRSRQASTIGQGNKGAELTRLPIYPAWAEGSKRSFPLLPGSSARSKTEIARACHFLTGQVISQWASDGDASASHDGIASAAATYADVTEKVDGRGLMESNDVSVDANA